ncbi:MAG: hypothetical protein RL030_1930 [Pseudomonadota bacterium]
MARVHEGFRLPSMPRALTATILPLLAALLLPPGAAAAAEATTTQWVPTPRATRLPISATNRPFLAADRSLSPVDLAAGGYVEEEILLSGRSSLYDWGPAPRSPAVVKGKGEAWTTRMLLRRPADAGKFSGRVVLEVLNAADAYDVAPLWGLSHAQFMRAGDAWVGLTVRPSALRTLQAFDSVRYATVKLPLPEALECQPSPDAEGGLAWDLIGQAGALLRSASRENPLSSLHPQRIIAAGYGEAGSYVVSYANAMHARWRLVGGAPVFDGYLDMAGTRALPLHPCATALADNDPRSGVLPRDVPFVVVMTQTELGRVLPVRRASSDARRDNFRYYELAGASRAGPWPAGRPGQTDLLIAGVEPPSADLCREVPGDYPAGLALNAVWKQYDALLTAGEAMIQTPRIEAGANGAPLLDTHGNVRGGWRLPQVDVPLASYGVHSTPAVDSDIARSTCAQTGSVRDLSQAQLRQMYRDRSGYLKRFNESVDAAVEGHRLLAEDVPALKNPSVRKLPAF